LNVNDIFLAIAKKLPKDGEGGGQSATGGTRLTQGGTGQDAPKLGSCCSK
jgi:Ras-related protein Rab-5C